MAAEAASEKKASDIIILDVREVTTISDYFLICSVDSQRQSRSVADNIDSVLSKKKINYQSIEGLENSLWILMDYGDLVIHIFKDEIRSYYDLEKMWRDSPKIVYEEKSESTIINKKI